MNEFSDFSELQSNNNDPSTYCQAWEECANYHFHNHDDRYLLEMGKPEGDSRGYADDATWILTSSFVIFTMQSGFGLLESGSCSPGFEVNIMMKNIVDVVFTALTYYLVGYGISFGEHGTPFMGKGNMPADGGYDEVTSGLLYSKYVFQLSFAATSTTIVSGAVAMRLKFFVYVLYSLIAVIFYSFVAHWISADVGFLKVMGAHDFAGGASVHVLGGTNALIATLFLGPRTGRFDGTKPITDFFPSSPASQCLGLLCLWWGWIGFNCGSSFGITDQRWVVAIRCAVTTINATVGGGITAIVYSLWRTKGKLVIPEHIINGILGSLVAITPACASVHTYDAFYIGSVGALVGLGTNTFICHLRIDDPVGAIGVHAGAGTWGLLAVGLFADSGLPGIEVLDGLFYRGGFKLLGLQVLTIICTMAWAIMWSTGFFYFVGVILSRDWRDPRKGLRVTREEEMAGADSYLHGVIDFHADCDRSTSNEHGSTSSGNLAEHNDERLPSMAKQSVTFAGSLYQDHFDNGAKTIKDQDGSNLTMTTGNDEPASVDDELKDVDVGSGPSRYSEFLKFLKTPTEDAEEGHDVDLENGLNNSSSFAPDSKALAVSTTRTASARKSAQKSKTPLSYRGGALFF